MMKPLCAIHRRRLVEKEKRVDEIECKVFIKCSDSNLLSICRELVFRDGLCSEATTCRRSLLWSSLSHWLAAASDKLSTEYQGEEMEEVSEQSVVTLTLQQEAANQHTIKLFTLGIWKKMKCSSSHVPDCGDLFHHRFFSSGFAWTAEKFVQKNHDLKVRTWRSYHFQTRRHTRPM